MRKDVNSVLFDLDGTLLDTAPDLASALNAVLAGQGHEPLPEDVIRPHVSKGARELVRLGFGIADDDPRMQPLWRQLVDVYLEHIADRTRLFEGMDEVLDRIERAGGKWGVVTNKPSWLTAPLMRKMDLAGRAACIVSGDTTPNRKPHPEPVLYACRQAGVTPARCVFVGDDRRDVQAGRGAGVRTLVALFGYIDTGQDPASWGADGLLESAAELSAWLDAPPAPP